VLLSKFPRSTPARLKSGLNFSLIFAIVLVGIIIYYAYAKPAKTTFVFSGHPEWPPIMYQEGDKMYMPVSVEANHGFVDGLHLAKYLEELEKEIKKCDNFVNKLILFGHNEAITNFVNKFGGEYIFNVPTSGLVFIEFEIDNWDNINQGKIIKKIFPKEIE
jgi:hypothetical protein